MPALHQAAVNLSRGLDEARLQECAPQLAECLQVTKAGMLALELQKAQRENSSKAVELRLELAAAWDALKAETPPDADECGERFLDILAQARQEQKLAPSPPGVTRQVHNFQGIRQMVAEALAADTK